MDLILNKGNDITKKSFTLNRQQFHRDGLILNVHHTDNNSRRLRFMYTCFNASGDLIASADSKGNLFLIDITRRKFWGLPTVDSCTLLQFSSYRECEILIGLKTNSIIIMNFEIGTIKGNLIGHKSVPNNISFSRCTFCLTSSKTEAIVWDLQNNLKLKILSLETGALLKHVSFLPHSNHIIGCYTDDMMNIWEFGTFRILRVIPHSIWNNMNIKYFAISCDGAVMAVSSNNPVLAVYSLKNLKLLKFIELPEHVKSIKFLKFITLKDNLRSILAILSGDGIILFLDTLKNIIISELKAQHEIIKFDHVDLNIFLSCVLCTGYIQIFDITPYTEKPIKVPALTEKKLKFKFQQRTSPSKIEELKEEMDDVLNIDKLRSILKEFGEYPETYRTLIWEQLLQLPNNTVVYDGIRKYQVQNVFQNIDVEYRANNRSTKFLKILLSNLVTWCGFFAHVHYLPVFVYPFLKVFQNRPIVCFEAIATILCKYGSHFFLSSFSLKNIHPK
ncbi:hypothetical protein WA026_017876 [Henosepilachna vigintioctopunctata]|uniref:TBC1 domain family member 31 n=1 Tax=Henosepilachna vigintioctopunctata TaxID=420089 RepID=A0AAW1TWG1_9CUCU